MANELLETPLKTVVKVTKEEACEMGFSIEIPLEDINQETESVYKSIQKRASLPGFRTGKAPIELVKKNFSDRARQTVLENLIGRAAAQVIREKQLQTVDTPKVTKVDFDLGKPLVFEMTVEKDPEVKAKNYKGIKLTQKKSTITDADVTAQLNEICERNASLIASSATNVAANHFAIVDFEGRIEGKSFPGGSAKNYLLDMSAPQTIAGFSEGILGLPVNEEKAIRVTFPKDYARTDYAGKEAEFKVTVKEIKEKKVPALDDDFAKDLGLASLEELKTKVRENMEKEEKTRVERDTEEQIHNALLDANPITVPPTLVAERSQVLLERTRKMLEQKGVIAPGDTQAEGPLRDKVKVQAERDVRLSYILKSIAAQETLEANEKDVQELKQKALNENKDSSADIEQYFKTHEGSVRASLTEGKIMDFLRNTAKIKQVD